VLADWQAAHEGGIADDIALIPFILLPPREWLRERCDRRLVGMFGHGAIEEVEALLARRLDPDLPAMRAIGVPQISRHLAGEITRNEALTLTQAATRQYAKRQFTWFRHQPPADWPRHDESLSVENINKIAIILRDRLLTG
jgi:tRNA dimethylallyltransferase